MSAPSTIPGRRSRTRPFAPTRPRPQISDERPHRPARFAPVFLTVALLALIFTPARTSQPATETRISPATTSAQRLLASLPSRFEPNVGQAGEGIAYTLKANGYLASLTANAIYFALTEGKSSEGAKDRPADPGAEQLQVQRSVLTMSFMGANPNPEIEALDPQEGKSNYLLGNDPKNWHTDVPGYSRIYYRGLYDGIDMVIYDDFGQVRYDFIVAPGADTDQIEIAFEGAQDVKVSDVGDLVISSPQGDLTHKAPFSYQGNSEIESAFEIRGDRAGFRLGAYDRAEELTIDPSLAYSSYLGGSAGDSGLAIDIDATGAAYVTGSTQSSGYPTTSPMQGSIAGSTDAFITKINAAGSGITYSTYLGGSAADFGEGIAVDSSGNAYLAGKAESANFPTASPIQAANGGGADAFVAKVNAAGSALTYSSYLGGSGGDYGKGIAIDSSGAAYVVGDTGSSNFPTASPIQGVNVGGSDVFVTKVNAAGSAWTYSTYIGGTSNEYVYDVAVDSSGAAYLAGETTSSNFPTASTYQGANGGSTDAFVTKVNSAGSAFAYSTYLGGTGTDYGYGIDVDSSGAAYVTGNTNSSNFPTASPMQGANAGNIDGFISKFTASGLGLTYSTYLGGTDDDFGYDVVVDSSGAVSQTGYTYSANFPMASPVQGTAASGIDATVSKISDSGSTLMFSTYLGGSSGDYGDSLVVDSAGAIYVVGQTDSTNFPTSSPVQPASGGGTDTFVTKLAGVPPAFPIRLNTTSEATESAGPASKPDVSNSGSRVAFHSPAGDLIVGDSNGAGDVFVKAPLTGTIERISVATDGTQGNGGSIVASMSPDSRYVAYFSQATNLVAGDTNGVGDVFLRDRTLGTTERISIADDEAQSNGASRYPQVTPDGRYVVFQSEASNLVAGDTNAKWDIFLRDRTLGTTERISIATDLTQSDKASARPSVSDDGNLITFHSWATNLVASDTNGLSDVFVRSRSGSATTRVSVATDGTQGNGESQFPKISGDGSVVVYHSTASNLVTGDTNSARDVFGRVLGSSTTERVSLTDGDIEANNASGYADISSNGRYVVFHSTASNLIAGDSNGMQDIFVRDRVAGTTRRVNATQAGGESYGIAGMAAISADGGHAAFQAWAADLIPSDTNGNQDVFYSPRP